MEGGAYLMYVTRKRWTGAEYSLFAIAFFAVSIILVYTFNFPRALLYFGDIINIFVLLMAIRVRAARGMRVSKTSATASRVHNLYICYFFWRFSFNFLSNRIHHRAHTSVEYRDNAHSEPH